MGRWSMKLQKRKQISRYEPQAKEEAGNKIKEDIDKLTDEIDDVLEANAEEFIRSYVQRSGE